MNISKTGVEFIKKWEGLRLKAYKCLSSEPYYTIGYGHYGKDVKANSVITEGEAEALLETDLIRHVKDVNKYGLKYCYNQNQFDAFVSFSFNVGSIKQLTDGGNRNLAQIELAWTKYCKSGKKEIEGLKRRRSAELELFRSRPAPIDDEENLVKLYPEELEEVCIDIVRGKYGNGDERIRSLTHAGFNPNVIQFILNHYYDVARDVIKGKYGNGDERKKTITELGHNYKLVQAIVNTMV